MVKNKSANKLLSLCVNKNSVIAYNVQWEYKERHLYGKILLQDQVIFRGKLFMKNYPQKAT